MVTLDGCRLHMRHGRAPLMPLCGAVLCDCTLLRHCAADAGALDVTRMCLCSMVGRALSPPTLSVAGFGANIPERNALKSSMLGSPLS